MEQFPSPSRHHQCEIIRTLPWYAEFAPAACRDNTVVFRDSAFVDDVPKTNVTDILEQRGPRNVRSL